MHGSGVTGERLFSGGIMKSDPGNGTGASDAVVVNGADSKKRYGGLCQQGCRMDVWMIPRTLAR